MAWIRHTWRTLANRHVALPAVVVCGPLLVVIVVAVIVVQSDTAPVEGASSTTPTSTTDPTTAPDPAPDPAPSHLEGLPPSCVDSTSTACSLTTGALALIADGADVDVRPDGTVAVDGDLAIPTSGGDVELIDGDVVIDIDDDGNIVDIDGTTDAPLPEFGALSAAVLLDGARAEIGYDWGRNLTDLGAHLQPDRQYFWFRFQSTWAMQTGFDQVVGDADALPVGLSTPGDVSVTMVLDPIDPYFYIGGPCPSYDSGGDDSGNNNNNNNNSSSNRNDSTEVRVGESVGEDCGLGVSQEGNIAFEATTAHDASGEFQPFDGHIVIDHSEIPVMTGVVLDGTMVVRTGSFLALGGNGDILLGVPIKAGVLDLTLPLGDASAGLRLPNRGTDRSGERFIAGVVDADRLGGELPDWLPIEPTQDAQVLASALLLDDPADGRLGPGSYVEMVGTMATTPDFLSGLTGVEVEPLSVADAVARIEATGVSVTGTGTASIHPSIEAGADLAVSGFVGFDDVNDSFVELVGSGAVGGVPLGADMSMRATTEGIRVAGAMATPLTTIGLQGWLTNDDIVLNGTARVDASTGGLSGLVDRAASLVEEARRALADVDELVDDARTEVREAREAAIAAAEDAVAGAERIRDRVSSRLTDTRGDLDELRDDLDDVLDDIVDRVGDVIDRLIPRELRDARDRLEREISDTRDRIDDLRDDLSEAGDDVQEAGAALRTLVEEHADVAVDEVRDVAERLAERRPVADALAVAERAASAVAGTAALDIDVQLASSGLAGAVTGEVCSADGCLDVTGGRVRFDDAVEVCFTVLGVEACVPF